MYIRIPKVAILEDLVADYIETFKCIHTLTQENGYLKFFLFFLILI